MNEDDPLLELKRNAAPLILVGMGLLGAAFHVFGAGLVLCGGLLWLIFTNI